jgi:hypothetical protein
MWFLSYNLRVIVCVMFLFCHFSISSQQGMYNINYGKYVVNKGKEKELVFWITN